MNDLKKHEGVDVQAALIELVKREDIDPSRLEHFLELQVKMEDRQNEKSFYRAMASFQGECPVIKRTKKVKFEAKSGKTTQYNYAPLDEMTEVVKPIMQKNGLSFSFDIEYTGGENLLVTTISHIDGHSKKSYLPFEKMHDDGRMNASQRRKSALSFAKRAALENALGVVTAEEDDDARRAIDKPVTDDQISEIKNISKSTDTTMQSLLKFLKVEKLEDLSEYEARRAITALKTKRTATSGVK